MIPAVSKTVCRRIFHLYSGTAFLWCTCHILKVCRDFPRFLRTLVTCWWMFPGLVPSCNPGVEKNWAWEYSEIIRDSVGDMHWQEVQRMSGRCDWENRKQISRCSCRFRVLYPCLILSIQKSTLSYDRWTILNLTLNQVPAYHMLYQPRSNHSQLCKFWGLSQFKHPWAVSQPCAREAVSSVLNSHSWEKRQMPPRARKRECFSSSFIFFLKVVDCIFPPVIAWRNLVYPK